MGTIVVAGIGTGVGKTVVSAALVEAAGADYWKPVQTGDPEDNDTRTVRSLVSTKHSTFHPETYRFKLPASPHAAAARENSAINSDIINLPVTNNHLVVELAGGLMVPLNDTTLNIDLVQRWGCGVVLVTRHYLGSINHTLLSLELLRRRNIPVKSLIISGQENISSEQAILAHGYNGLTIRIPEMEMVDGTSVRTASRLIIPHIDIIFK